MRGIAALAALAVMPLCSCGAATTCAGLEQGTLVFAFQASCAGAPCSPGNATPAAGTCGYFASQIAEALTTPPGGAMPTTRFTATVSWRDNDAPPPAQVAALCIQAPLAQDKIGTFTPIDASTYTLAFPFDRPGRPGIPTVTAPPGAIGKCPCAVDLSEALGGTLKRGSDEKLSFSGTLRTVLARSSGATDAACYAASATAVGIGDCPPAGGSCTVDWVAP